MNDLSYIYQTFDNFFVTRSPNIFINGSTTSLNLNELKYMRNPALMKANYFQTRLLDFLYNSDDKTMECNPFINEPNYECPTDNNSFHYLLVKNKYMGMVFHVVNFENDPSVNSNLNLFSYIYDSPASIEQNLSFFKNMNTFKDSGYITERQCVIESKNSSENFYFQSYLENILYFPSNITKCKALNIALKEHDMFDGNIQKIEANIYFKNSVSGVILCYSIVFSREIQFGIPIYINLHIKIKMIF